MRWQVSSVFIRAISEDLGVDCSVLEALESRYTGTSWFIWMSAPEELFKEWSTEIVLKVPLSLSLISQSSHAFNTTLNTGASYWLSRGTRN